jgi:hypothetical protein
MYGGMCILILYLYIYGFLWVCMVAERIRDFEEQN